MGLATIFGLIITFGGFYEFYKSLRNYNFTNNSYIIIYDNSLDIHIISLEEINKSIENKITDNTQVYFSKKHMDLCAISLEKIKIGDEIRELKCKHVFKKNNIDIWLSKNNTCPVCRKIVYY